MSFVELKSDAVVHGALEHVPSSFLAQTHGILTVFWLEWITFIQRTVIVHAPQ